VDEKVSSAAEEFCLGSLPLSKEKERWIRFSFLSFSEASFCHYHCH
jgi:hypothetical protein